MQALCVDGVCYSSPLRKQSQAYSLVTHVPTSYSAVPSSPMHCGGGMHAYVRMCWLLFGMMTVNELLHRRALFRFTRTVSVYAHCALLCALLSVLF